MKRQGLTISIKELIQLRHNLEMEQKVLSKELGIDFDINYNSKFIVGIINKKGLNDTWEIE